MSLVAMSPDAAHAPPLAEHTPFTRQDPDLSDHILPPPPNPSTDAALLRLSPDVVSNLSPTSPSSIDVFTLTSVSALKYFCAGVEALVRMTGDIPPTPPLSNPTTPHIRGIMSEKENIAKMQLTGRSTFTFGLSSPRTPNAEEIDGVAFRKQPLGSPASPSSIDPYTVIGANAEPINVQHSAITRKFYSKKPPPISLEDYLMRIHQYCPMSTAVYLAASYYIHKLAVVEQAIPVTRRNCHRLMLAGLRVAMKALEDLSYPHKRFSKVGGVSENELARLEISFCFLMGFELGVKREVLRSHAVMLKELSTMQGAVGGFGLKLPLGKKNFPSRAGDVVTADA
jgi:hypothetical protein